MNFDEVLASVERPTARFSPETIAMFFPRVRWFQYFIVVEKGLKYHKMSDLLPDKYYKANPLSLKRCGENCAQCYGGNEREGFLALSCWTREVPPFSSENLSKTVEYLQNSILSGRMVFEVPESQLFGGESYTRWEEVCHPARKLAEVPLSGLCLTGLSAYRVKIDDPNLTDKVEVAWVVRLWFKETRGELELSRRLDGASVVVLSRKSNPIVRKILFILNKTIFYKNFSTLYCKDNSPAFASCCGEFELETASGKYRCSFVPKAFESGDRKKCSFPSGGTTVETPFFSLVCRGG